MSLGLGFFDRLGDAHRASGTAAAQAVAAEDVGLGSGAVGDSRRNHGVGQAITDADNHSVQPSFSRPPRSIGTISKDCVAVLMAGLGAGEGVLWSRLPQAGAADGPGSGRLAILRGFCEVDAESG